MATIGSSPTAWQLQLEESDRRFYRELNDIKIGFGRPPVFHPCDPMMNQVYERTIFVMIHREFFAISDEILYEVFSRYGIIDWVERLSRGFHSTILFRDKESALWAFELLNGLNLYGDCCQLELFLAKQPEERSKSSASTSRDESVGFQELVNPNTTSSEESTMAIEVQTSIDLVEIQIQSEFPETLANDNIRGSFEPLEIEAQEIEDKGSVEVEATIEESSQETKSIPQINHPSREIEEDEQELQNQTDFSKVISIYPSFAKINVELVKTTELGKHCIASVKRVGESVEDLTDFRKSSVEFLEYLSAHKLFVKMPGQGESPIAIAEDIVKYRGQPMNSVFDPGIAEILVADSIDSIEVGIADFAENAYKLFDEMSSRGITMMGREYGNFDPGDVSSSKFAGFEQTGSAIVVGQDRFQWDPGGMCVFWNLGRAIEEVFWSHFGKISAESGVVEVPEKSKDSAGGPWTFVGLLPLFDPPRHDSAETISRALNLGADVKMITGDQLEIAIETSRRLGLGTNMDPSSSLLGRHNICSVHYHSYSVGFHALGSNLGI